MTLECPFRWEFNLAFHYAHHLARIFQLSKPLLSPSTYSEATRRFLPVYYGGARHNAEWHMLKDQVTQETPLSTSRGSRRRGDKALRILHLGIWLRYHKVE
jgi:hypothetical protein